MKYRLTKMNDTICIVQPKYRYNDLSRYDTEPYYGPHAAYRKCGRASLKIHGLSSNKYSNNPNLFYYQLPLS